VDTLAKIETEKRFLAEQTAERESAKDGLEAKTKQCTLWESEYEQRTASRYSYSPHNFQKSGERSSGEGAANPSREVG